MIVDPTTEALIREANDAHADLLRVVTEAGPIFADAVSPSPLNALTWLARDPVHTQIHEAVERLCAARAKVVLALRLDYARKDSARARTSLNSASVDSRPPAFSEHDAEQ